MHDLPTPDWLASNGFFGRETAAASVTESFGVPGSGDAERTFRARVMGGLEFDVIASRGFDIGDTFYNGIPLSWFSPIADARALSSLLGAEWISRFNGGLLTTCGLDNIGPATASAGLHGSHNHLAAREIRHSSSIRPNGPAVILSASVESVALFGLSLILRRRISSSVGENGAAVLLVKDEVQNIGREPAPFSLLYHLNFGAPLILPGTIIEVDSAASVTRHPNAAVPRWQSVPEPIDMLTEAVFEHERVSVDQAGYAHAAIVNEAIGLRVDLGWTAASLPRLYQWIFPTRGRWALAIEPANAPLFGDGREEIHSGAPVLPAGAKQYHEITMAISKHDSATRDPSRDLET